MFDKLTEDWHSTILKTDNKHEVVKRANNKPNYI